MSKWRIHTPEGFQDILFAECAVKRSLEERLRRLFKSCGYFEVETPTVEFYDVFSFENGRIPEETMYKFFDQRGRILALRPDITIPVARITATKYKDSEFPLRCSYIGNVFRYNEYGGGKQNEFTQAGVELLGVNTPESDAEVIAIAINSLKEVGLKNFQVDIGQVEFFNGLMEETGWPDEDVANLRCLIDSKDFIGVKAMLDRTDLREDLKNLIYNLPSFFGRADIIDKAKELTGNDRCLYALENIRNVIDILEEYGLGQYLTVDLGMLRDLDYDTGIIFRGFTDEMGFPVLAGGRYDRLLAGFGKDCPATGFAMSLGLVTAALQRQNAPFNKPVSDTLVCCDKEARKEAYLLCDELRSQGLIVEFDVTGAGMDELKRYAEKKEIGGIIKIFANGEVELLETKTGNITRTNFEELLKR